MNLRFLLLPVVVLSAGCSTKEAPPTSEPAAAVASYTPGTKVMLVDATIDQTGGTLAGPAGTPIEGWEVTFPAGAVSEPTTFSLGYDTGTFADVVGAPLTNTVIVLESSGQHEFAVPITFSFPFTDPVKYPIPYYIKPDGHLEALRPLAVDRAGGRGGFASRHASPFTYADGDPSSPSQPIMTLFRPEYDGFAFANSVDDKYFPNGRCWGISAFTKWYFDEKGGGLASLYTQSVPTQTSTKTALTAQEVVATRAQISVSINASETSSCGQACDLYVLFDALAEQKSPVMVGLTSPKSNSGHAVLAIGVGGNEIAVYDSNYPLQTMSIPFSFSDIDTATISYDGWTELSIFDSGIPRHESFESILEDAQGGFYDENQTHIEITSHTDDQTVSSQDIILKGKVHSGEVRIDEVSAWVLYSDLTESDPQTVSLEDGQDEFSVPLELHTDGPNRVLFKTRGYVQYGEGLREIPNDLDQYDNSRTPFTLNYGTQANPDSRITLNFEMSEVTDTTRVDTIVKLDAPLSYVVNTSTPAKVSAPTFDLAEWCSYDSGPCDIVTGHSTTNEQDWSNAQWLPISITAFHTDSYEKNADGGWDPTGTWDSPNSDVNCEWLGVRIFAEPEGTPSSHQYRLQLSKGGNITCPAMQGQLPPLGRSMQCSGADCDLGCVTPPRISSTDIEQWATSPSGQKTWNLLGTANCSDGYMTTTETSHVSITLVPCNGGPCTL